MWNWARGALTALGVLAPIGGAVWFAFGGATLETAGLSLILGLYLALMARLDLIAEVSLGPLAAKMKSTIEEAKATVSQLKTIASAVAKVELTSLAGGEFIAGVPSRKRFDLHDELIEELRKLGLTDQEIESISENWNRVVQLKYWRAVDAEFKRACSGRENYNELAKEWNSLVNFENWQLPPISVMRSALMRHSALTSDAVRWLEDLEHFQNTREIRRRDEVIKA